MPLTKILIFFFLREIISFGNLPRTAKYARSVAVRSKGIDHSYNDIGGAFLEAPPFSTIQTDALRSGTVYPPPPCGFIHAEGIDHGTRREIGMGKLSKQLRKLGIEISRTICYNTLTMQG